MINDYCKKAYKNACEHGFHNDNNDVMTKKLVELALISSEVGECIEAVRKNDNLNTRKGVCFENAVKDTEEDELADICIRIFDYCGEHNIDLEEAINQKMEYNKSRPFKHGKLV